MPFTSEILLFLLLRHTLAEKVSPAWVWVEVPPTTVPDASYSVLFVLQPPWPTDVNEGGPIMVV